MGLVVDSSVIIALERAGSTAEQILLKMIEVAGDQRAVLSAVGLSELVHGIYRSRDTAMLQRRLAFLQELLTTLDVASYTKTTALLSGQIDAEARMQGTTIPFSDLLIGATALEIGYAVLTLNPRHFSLIPNLQVAPLVLKPST